MSRALIERYSMQYLDLVELIQSTLEEEKITDVDLARLVLFNELTEETV